MSRHYFVARKVLSAKWSWSLLEFFEEHYPALLKKYGYGAEGPALTPPAREGLQEKAPFLAIPYDVFRRGVKQVSTTTSTEMRGAAEAHLVQDPSLTRAHEARSLQLFVGHEAGASLKHYRAQSSAAMSRRLASLAEGGVGPKKVKGKKANRAKKAF